MHPDGFSYIDDEMYEVIRRHYREQYHCEVEWDADIVCFGGTGGGIADNFLPSYCRGTEAVI